jgi:hypothetical protein
MSDRESKIKGLREFADWMEQNPDAPFPEGIITFNVFVDSAQEFVKLRRIMQARDKLSVNELLFVSKVFPGLIRYDVNLPREQACRRVKVGQQLVPARPAVPEHMADVFEWDCGSVLQAAEEQANASAPEQKQGE